MNVLPFNLNQTGTRCISMASKAGEERRIEQTTVSFRSEKLGIRIAGGAENVDDGVAARFVKRTGSVSDASSSSTGIERVRADDVLIRIAGISTLGMTFSEVERMLKESASQRPLQLTFRRTTVAEAASSILKYSPMKEDLKRAFLIVTAAAAVESFGGGLVNVDRMLRAEREKQAKQNDRGFFTGLLFGGEDSTRTVDAWRVEHQKRMRKWLHQISTFFDVENLDEKIFATRDVLADMSDAAFVRIQQQVRPRALVEETIAGLCILSLCDGQYDATVRRSILLLCRRLGCRQRVVSAAETQFAHALRMQRIVAMRGDNMGDDADVRKKKRTPWGRYALVTGGTIVGGLIVGFTGGLAVPALAAGIGTFGASIGTVFGTSGAGVVALSSFLATTGGAAVATTLFGATGASLTAYKLSRRTRDISTFRFVLCESRGDSVRATICISGWVMSRKDFTCAWGVVSEEGDEDNKDQMLLINALRRGDISAREYARICEVKRQARIHRLATVSTTPLSLSKSSSEAASKSDASLAKQVRWWNDVMRRESRSDMYALVWEPKELIALGNALTRILKTEAINTALGQTLKATALGAIMSAVIWPAALVKISDLIDNPWSVAMSRADRAGVLLAEALSSGAYGRRPVRLVGYSLGARIIFRALLELHRLGSKRALGVVEEVTLLGLPEVNSRTKWRAARSVVSGRIVNGHIKDDWVLSYLFRAMEWRTKGIAGISGASCPGVEDYDLKGIVGGHLEYRTRMRSILEAING